MIVLFEELYYIVKPILTKWLPSIILPKNHVQSNKDFSFQDVELFIL